MGCAERSTVIIDWEMAGSAPREWVRTKVCVSSGMDLSGDDDELETRLEDAAPETARTGGIPRDCRALGGMVQAEMIFRPAPKQSLPLRATRRRILRNSLPNGIPHPPLLDPAITPLHIKPRHGPKVPPPPPPLLPRRVPRVVDDAPPPPRGEQLAEREVADARLGDEAERRGLQAGLRREGADEAREGLAGVAGQGREVHVDHGDEGGGGEGYKCEGDEAAGGH